MGGTRFNQAFQKMGGRLHVQFLSHQLEFCCSARPGAVTTGCTQMEVGCRPSGQGWELIGFFFTAEWWKSACFSSDSTYPWDENHPPKKNNKLWENILLATFSDHSRSKSRLEMFETWPGGQQLNLLNIMFVFFPSSHVYKRIRLLKRSKIRPSSLNVARWWCLSMFILLLLDDVFTVSPSDLVCFCVFLVRVTSNSILEPGV